MFERFTDRARQVVVFAQDEARMLRHDYIGTEHILLGLLRDDDGVAARVLDSLGITAERVRSEVARYAGQGDEISTGQIPFTARAKRALEFALREGLALGSRSVGTEHILLGLIREQHGLAARLLGALGITIDDARARVVAITGTGTETTTGHLAFTPQAKHALERARREAFARKSEWVDTEHLLLGILRQDGIAGRIVRDPTS